METLGHLAAVWRYPVKSLAGESLNEARVDIDGLAGDRTWALNVASGHPRTGKTYRGKEHNLLHTTNDVTRALDMGASRGVTLQLESERGKRYFDDAPVSLIFDTWIAQVESALGMQLDPRRWRPNLYARAAHGFSVQEADLVGSTISAGTVILRVCDTIKRCVTPTYDITTGESNGDVLDYVARARKNVMGVYCEVELTGTVRAGDPLLLRDRWTSRTTCSSASM